ncbi:unnamed protein product [Effrenium voratum]|nr:unnamed protein product [Effrenium voratum]
MQSGGCLCGPLLLLMSAPRSQSFAVQGETPAKMGVARSQSFAGYLEGSASRQTPAAVDEEGGQEEAEELPAMQQPSTGPATPQRPQELRELSTEVPREPSWPSDGVSSWKNAEVSTPTSVSSAGKAAGESQPTAQGSLGNAAWDAASPESKAGSGTPKKCAPKNPFWVQPEVAANKKVSRGSCDGMSSFLSGAAPLRCLSDVVDAGDRNFEIEIAEEDLTTVHISSWEQRLDWRSFLSEAVASSLARQAFMNFDVEAEPPSYPRPPPSARSAAVAHGVAPSGSGIFRRPAVSQVNAQTEACSDPQVSIA